MAFYKTKVFRNTMKILAVVLCLIGLIEQVQHVSQRYFEYRTRTIIKFSVQTYAHYPSVSICFRYHDILNRTRVKENYKHLILKKWNEDGYNPVFYYEQTKNLTISEMFKFTPEANTVLNPKIGCTIRFPSKLTTRRIRTSECYDSFSVKKFLISENVCFLFVPRMAHKDLMLHEFTLSSGFTGQMYRLIFDSNVFHYIYPISVAIHSNESAFLTDRTFASTLELKMKHLPTTNIFYRKLIRTRLPSPFDSKCRYSEGDMKSFYGETFKHIDKKAISMYNVSIPFFPSFNPLENVRKLMNSRGYQVNESLTNQIVDLIAKYDLDINTCFQLNYITRTQLITDNSSSFIVYWTKDENLISQYAPEQEILDFIVYVCSCIGIWFGFSAYSVLNVFISLTSSDKTHRYSRSYELLDGKIRDQQRSMKSLHLKYRIVCRRLDADRNFNRNLYNSLKLRTQQLYTKEPC